MAASRAILPPSLREAVVRDVPLLAAGEAEQLLAREEEDPPAVHPALGVRLAVGPREHGAHLAPPRVEVREPGARRPGVVLAAHSPVVLEDEVALEAEQPVV